MNNPEAKPCSTLHHVTKRKLEKLSEHIKQFEERKQSVLEQAAKESTPREQVQTLLEASKKNGLLPHGSATNFKQIRSYLTQAEYDPSITETQIQQWKGSIEGDIDVEGRKLVYAKLFGDLCLEWADDKQQRPSKPLSAGVKRKHESSDDMDVDPDTSSNDSFVDVESSATQLEEREMWEQYAFSDCPKDHKVIDSHLKDLFVSARQGKKLEHPPLKELQLAMGRFETTEPKRFSPAVVEQCIDQLLKADFFIGGKRQELIEMREKVDVLVEVADVLNMDLDTIDTWQWEKPIALHPRRMLNGKHRVFYDEEVHQAIFLQFIGMKWAVLMKTAFTKFFHSGSWTQAPFHAMDRASRRRRDYFLGPSGTRVNSSVRANRRKLYQNEFFMVQLPNSMQNSEKGYGDHEDREWGDRIDYSARVSARGADTSSKHPAEKKDLLHRLVTTEMLVQTAVYGEFTVLQSDFRNFGLSVPHDTIFAVLKFFGVKRKWLDFIEKFLQPRVYWADDMNSGEKPKVEETSRRKRGVPMTHALSDALTEAILFCLDFEISRATAGTDLWRFHDDLWFWGQEQVVIQAWKSMQDFSELMGLELNMEKTGCTQVFDCPELKREMSSALPQRTVTWGLLKLDVDERCWAIDDKRIEPHMLELARQLNTCKGALAWIQAWNAYACRFLSANLGRPAACLGSKHVEMLLQFHRAVQSRFSGKDKNLQGHLRQEISKSRFVSKDFVSTIPDAFFYFSHSFGGLGVHNPCIELSGVRSDLLGDPIKLIIRAFDRDEEDYEEARKRYEDGDFVPRRRPDSYKPIEPKEDFMSFDEFVRFREESSPHLARAYDALLGLPEVGEVHVTPAIRDAVHAARGGRRWHDLSSCEQWLFELYGKNMIEQFGGMAFGDKNMLPLGMMDSLKSEKTRWIA